VTVCVHGLGYVGLPTAAILANTGHKVYGFDTDPKRRQTLEHGAVNFDEPDLNRFVERALDDGLEVVEEPKPTDVHLICVPTPYDKEANRTDLSYVESASEKIAAVLRPDDVVVLESTVPPGTTEGLLREIVECSGLSTTDDVTLGYSPETVLPGNTLAELRNNDRIVGTASQREPDQVVELYDSFVSGTIRTTDATTAEFVKLIQNAYRDVNIAFANEVAKLANEFGVGSRNAISLANNHPRVDILRPGPGVGGHCIPVDPLFLNHDNEVPNLIKAARDVNDGMVMFVEELLTAALDDLQGTVVTLFGVAYKGGVGDTRESPALKLADRLEQRNVAEVRFTDPYVNADDVERPLWSLEESLDGADAAVLVTDHPEYGALMPERFDNRMQGNVVVDTRAMLDIERWEAAGFEIYQF